MDWFGLVKRYIWSDEKTPYLVKVKNLSFSQARNETYAYAVFMAFLFPMLGVVLLRQAKAGGDLFAFWLALHAFTVFAAAVLFWATRSVYAAFYCGSGPVSAFLILVTDLLELRLLELERLGLIAFTLGWMWYAARVVSIARIYPQLAEKEDL